MCIRGNLGNLGPHSSFFFSYTPPCSTSSAHLTSQHMTISPIGSSIPLKNEGREGLGTRQFNYCKKTILREKEEACLENTFCLSLVSMPAASSVSLL